MERVPTPLEAALFRLKVRLLQAKRLIKNAGTSIRRHPRASVLPDAILVELRSRLWNETDAREFALERGKVHNLRVVSKALDRTLLPAGAVFSFWRQVGRTTAHKGYVVGRQIETGCLIPALGGGICQLTNALYEAALAAGCEIIERHPHTRRVPNAPADRPDATVLWNHIDLRLRSKRDLVLRTFLTADELVVQLLGARGSTLVTLPTTRSANHVEAKSCASCEMPDCFRNASGPTAQGRTAILVDQPWPEFETYLRSCNLSNALMLIPIDARRYRRPGVRWQVGEVGEVRFATRAALLRTLRLRKLANEGPARRRAALESDESIGKAYASRLDESVTTVIVYQQFLPFLWREGHLGGRSFEVLMTRLPLAALHDTLDSAAASHPERSTLTDFRAPAWMVEAESEALASADRVVTPHATIASLFPTKAIKLDWELPPAVPVERGCKVAYVGPAIARKGVYEIREVAQRSQLPIVLVGTDLMPSDFWDGVDLTKPQAGSHWLNGVGVVVQPAVVEDQPRRLLQALACGVPVVASEACGLGAVPGVTIVPNNSAAVLEHAVNGILKSN